MTGKIKRNKKNRIKQGGFGYILFQVFSKLFFLIFAFICVYPLWYIIIYSLTNPALVGTGLTFLPRGFTLKHYEMVFQMADIYRAFLVSTYRALAGTALTLFFSAMFAYVLTKSKLPFRRFVYRIMVASMYLSVGLIPWVITMTAYGLRNNLLLYILPYAISPFYVILIKTYMESIPEAIEEAALIDGANYFKIFSRVMLPVVKPVLAAVAVFSAVGQWNMWQDNLFMISRTELNTLQFLLYRLLEQTQAIAAAIRTGNVTQAIGTVSVSPMGIRTTTTVVTIIPILLVYPFLQRQFAKGIMLGAIKA